MEGLYKIYRAQNRSVCWNGKPALWVGFKNGGAQLGAKAGGVCSDRLYVLKPGSAGEYPYEGY
jgi:hypothetical protein